jgi:hypothetical protein
MVRPDESQYEMVARCQSMSEEGLLFDTDSFSPDNVGKR